MRSSKYRKILGTIKSVNRVELMIPPIEVTASGAQMELDSLELKVIGRKPKSVAVVVMRMGRSRSLPA